MSDLAELLRDWRMDPARHCPTRARHGRKRHGAACSSASPSMRWDEGRGAAVQDLNTFRWVATDNPYRKVD